MSVRGAVECILHAARGLAYAHAQKIIHRDIKPANLLQDAKGVVKVTDLGLARLNPSAMTDGGETAASSVTQAGSILGTADYMPPEQAVDATVIDHRADIYSLGATLHFLLTGQGPYTASSLMGILLKHRDAPIPSLCEACKDVPPELDQLFRRMLAKDPRHRPQEMTQVVSSLEAILGSLGAAPAAAVVAEPTAAPLSDRPTDASQVLDKTVVGGLPSAANFATTPTAAPSVLLVEPSRTQAGIIRRYLQSLELTNVVSVTTGADALNAFQSHRPDVVITAMHLNDMKGTELANRIRADKSAAAPGFVLISSESEGKEAEALGHSGHAALLHKPFTADSLMSALKLACPAFANLKTMSASTYVAPTPLTPARRPCHVLLVDDSAAARFHIRNVLASLGLTHVSEAEDGAEAVACLAREKYDLIITDYNMPLMDGRGLIAYMRQNPATASVPIIMVTTETDPSRLDAIRQLGVTVCAKSFPVDVARKLIDTLLHR
jgi:CheY-like chemotaxis protein